MFPAFKVKSVLCVLVPSQLGPGALSLDLIAQHCTLLPPELVSLPPGIPGAPGLLAPATTFISQEQDIVNNNITDNGMDFTPVHIKEVSLKQIRCISVVGPCWSQPIYKDKCC